MLRRLHERFTSAFWSASHENPAESSQVGIEPADPSSDGLSLLVDSRDVNKLEDRSIEDVVFIPDLAQSFAKTWGKESIKALLQPYELRTFNFDYTPSHVHHLQDLVRYDAIERLAKKLLIDLRQVNAQEPGRRFAPRFVAHGYGGLICELAYLLNQKEDDKVEMDGFILFGTPHFRAGLAQWALISAKKQGIPCADRPRQQDWSELKKDLDQIAGMQTSFCDLNPGPKLACYFALRPTIKPQLRISPEWAILPGARSAPLDSDHFGMTILSTAGSQRSQHLVNLLIGEVPVRVSEETLLKHWKGSVRENTRSEQNTPNAIPFQVAKQLLLDQQADPLKITQTLVELTAGNEDDGMSSTKWLLDEHGDRISEEHKLVLLKAAAGNERQGKAICGLLLARYDESQLPINEEIVQIAAQNEDSGLDILEMLAVWCQNGVPFTKNIIEAAARIDRNGLERLKLLFQQQKRPVAITGMIIEAATSNLNKTNRAGLVNFLDEKLNIRVSLDEAASEGYDDLVELLLDTEDINVNLPQGSYGLTPLLRAVIAGRENTVGLLLDDRRVDVNLKNQFGRTPLLRAVEEGQEKIVGRLLDDKRVDVNSEDCWGVTPLILAAKTGQSTITSLLLRANGIDVNKKVFREAGTPLFWASWRGHTDIVKQLLQRDDTEVDKPAENGQTSLSVAAQYEHETIVTLLLENPKRAVDVNSKDGDGWTPLAYAVANNKGAMITRKLLEAKADAAIVNGRGYGHVCTPFVWAVRSGREDIVKLLLATGKVDINIRDVDGCTAFLWAAREGKEGTLRLFLETIEMDKEDINSRDNEGRTPYWWAMDMGHKGIIALLRETGMLDENIHDDNGKTPRKHEQDT